MVKGKKTFKLKTCLECGSNKVRVLLKDNDCEKSNSMNLVDNSSKVGWICEECNWKGLNPLEKDVSEKEYLEYADSLENEYSERNEKLIEMGLTPFHKSLGEMSEWKRKLDEDFKRLGGKNGK